MTVDQPQKPSAGIDAFHRQRSRCIDAFAAVEMLVASLLRRNGEKCSGEPFGMKAGALLKVKASPGYSAATKKKVDAALGRVLELLPVRGDIVHARMKLVVLEGVNHAQFVNAATDASLYPPCRLLTLDHLRDLTRRVEELAGELEKV